MGRNSSYSPELAELICSRLASGESLRSICRDPELPAQSTVFKWLTEHPSFSEQYAHARTAQMEAMAEEILEIADDGSNDTYETEDGEEKVNQDVIQRSRLRVDTRKWLMSKLAPKKYGDKVEQFISGPDGGPVQWQVTVEFVKLPKSGADVSK